MLIYNTLTRQKEEFLPAGSKIRMFVCGPTVYDFSHIGHARTYVVFDVIAKYLRHCGYDVFYLQNITDIDDKIIERAKQKMINLSELAQEYKEAYYEDMKSLGITAVSEYTPATQYIPEIVSQVKRLLEKGVAYLIEDDGYYFDLNKFPDYGKLSGRTTQAAEDAVSRIDESVKKRNRGDFALWKFSKPEEPGWDSELGYGRPGWHIEDTAITEKRFGLQYDLHGGAQDLIFPHHEAEIAQMESISGKKPFVKYWLHPGFLTVSGQKMSKSLGNFLTIRDALKKYPAEALRLMILMAHYRSPIDYSEENLRQTEAAVNRLAEFTTKLKNLSEFNSDRLSTGMDMADLAGSIMQLKDGFQKEMDDDFNTPRAIAAIFEFIRAVNPLLDKSQVKPAEVQGILKVFVEFNQILGIIPEKTQEIPPEVQKLVSERETARQAKDFSRADQLREEIKNLGYEIEDTTYGPLIKKP